MGDASDSNNWIIVDRSKKNRKKVGVLREISNQDLVLNVSFSNSKDPKMLREIAPKVLQASVPKCTHRSVNFKPKTDINTDSFPIKKSKNSLDKPLAAFSEDLKKVIKTQESIQLILSKADHQIRSVKQELTDSANLLLLHKGLTRRLQQLQNARHPVILKTKNALKLQKKYEDYINSVDNLRDTVGKLKVQSIKVSEGIGKWKQQQRISTDLLNEYLNHEDQDQPSLIDDDCLEASSSAPPDEYYENYDDYNQDWNNFLAPPTPDRRCRFVHHERKPPAKTRYPTCPVQLPISNISERQKFIRRREHPMETPIINENNLLAKQLNKLQNELQNLNDRKHSIDENMICLRQKVGSLIRQDAHYDTIGEAEMELSSLITEGAWTEKEIICISNKMDELRKRQGFTKIARAFMATTPLFDDPFQITTSLIHTNASDDVV